MSGPLKAALFALLMSALIVGSAYARDGGQWENIDPSTRDWFKGLKNSSGVPCCDTSDGQRLDDADWRLNEDGSYSVRIAGEWRAVPPAAVLDVPNRVGVAVVWLWNGLITCFLRGTEG